MKIILKTLLVVGLLTLSFGFAVIRTNNVFAAPPPAAIFTVNDTGDGADAALDGACDDGSGNCTLRAAIAEANNVSGTDLVTINFNIAGGGPHTITLTSDLPPITRTNVIIDATTAGQSGNGGSSDGSTCGDLWGIGGSHVDPVWNVVIDAGGFKGFDLDGGNSTIKGLEITNSESSPEQIAAITITTNDANTIQCNYLTANGGRGIDVYTAGNTIGGPNIGDGNVISGNGLTPPGLSGIFLETSAANSNTVQGNFIGTNIAGTVAVGNGANAISIDSSNNTIGGTTPGEGNLLSGNLGNGITFHGISPGGTNNLVEGNYMGTDISGNVALPNSNSGILTESGSGADIIGGTTAGARNIISGNTLSAITISSGSDGHIIEGNYIGLGANGTTILAGQQGISIASSSNTVGGTISGAGNIIVGNTNSGVSITGGADNSILQNSIYGNAHTGIVISGTSILQNHPVVTSALKSGGLVTVAGTLNSLPSTTFRIELFSNPSSDTPGNSQGQTYLGSTSVTTDGSGNGSFSVPNLGGLSVGNSISATATDPAGNTSVFSAETAVDIPGSVNLVVNSTLDTSDASVGDGICDDGSGHCTLRAAIQEANAWHGGGTVTFNIGSGVQTITVGSDLPAILEPVMIDASTEGGSSCNDVQSGVNPVLNVVLSPSGGSALSGLVTGGPNITIKGFEVTGFTKKIGKSYGIQLGGTGNIAECNSIHDNANGISLLANNDTVGGTAAGAGNVIFSNNGTHGGVAVQAVGDAISGNSIFGNAVGAIILSASSPTLNDSRGHSGPNNFQNFPVITSATVSGGTTTVSGTLDSTPNGSFRVEFFANPTQGVLSGGNYYGDGRYYLGSKSVTTSGGHASFTATGLASTTVGYYVSTTATDNAGDTSEFSADAQVTSVTAPAPVAPVAPTVLSGGISGGSAYVCIDPHATNYQTYPGIGNTSCHYAITGSPSTAQILGSGTCPANLIIHDFMKQGDRNGAYSSYIKKNASEISILQGHINRILATSYNQAAGPVDGIFGKLTKQGVERLQAALNTVLKPVPALRIDGIVGPYTKATINDSCGNQ